MKQAPAIIQIIGIAFFITVMAGCSHYYLGKVYQPNISQEQLKNLDRFEKSGQKTTGGLIVFLKDTVENTKRKRGVLHEIRVDSLVLVTKYNFMGEPRKTESFAYGDIEKIYYRFSEGLFILEGVIVAIPLTFLLFYAMFLSAI